MESVSIGLYENKLYRHINLFFKICISATSSTTIASYYYIHIYLFHALTYRLNGFILFISLFLKLYIICEIIQYCFF